MNPANDRAKNIPATAMLSVENVNSVKGAGFILDQNGSFKRVGFTNSKTGMAKGSSLHRPFLVFVVYFKKLPFEKPNNKNNGKIGYFVKKTAVY